MKTILITTDLSKESRVAFELGRTYAAALNAKVILAAMIEDPAQAAMVYAMDYPVLPDSEVLKQLKDKVGVELQGLAKEHFQGIDIECVVHEATGPTHVEILDFAKARNVDLIVMATHGRTGISRLLIGSITEKVVRESTCPVLTVPVRK